MSEKKGGRATVAMAEAGPEQELTGTTWLL